MGKNKGALLLGIYLFLAVYLLPMFPHGGSANELTRWATAASLVEHGSFDIAWTEGLIGPNVDTARVDEHIYSNKAPGTAILAAPFYAITRIFAGRPDASNIRVSWFVMRFALSSIPLLLLGLWLYRKGVDEFSLATLLFATPLFVYSLLFFSHVLAAVLVYAAFRCLYDDDHANIRTCLAAGAMCGLAVICEFPAVIPIAIIGIGLLFKDAKPRSSSVVGLIAGGIPFAIFLLAYNASLFGSPLSMSYAHESFPEWAEVAGQGVFGIGLPTVSNIVLLLISPSRGLFFTSPVFVLAVLSFWKSPDRSSLRFRVSGIAIIATIIAMFGHGAAHGGWAFGPRYLVVVMPLMLDPLFRDGDRLPVAWRSLLFAISLVFCVIPILTFPFAPPEFNAPHNDFWTRLLLYDGWVAPNMANVAGLSSSLLNLLPVVIALAAVVTIVVSSRESFRLSLVGAIAGLATAATWMFTAGLNSYEDAFRRATIEERFFKPADRLGRFKHAALNARDWPAVRRINDAEWNIADSRANAPDDFPYAEVRPLESSPTSMVRSAVEAQQRGDTSAAQNFLIEAKGAYTFARCELAANIAVIHYAAGRKEAALAELESVQPDVNPGSRSECLRTQFLLATIYGEFGRHAVASDALRKFVENTSSTKDRDLLALRNQLTTLPK